MSNRRFHTNPSPPFSVGRRRFIQRIGVMALGVQLPWLMSCKTEKSLATGGVLTREEARVADFVLDGLLPEDSYGPSSRQVNAYSHFLWVLQDPNYDPDKKSYYKEGLGWVAEKAEEDFNRSVARLNNGEKRQLLHRISRTDWGESWMSAMLTLVIEALLGDPIYGINPEGISWKWLSHNPGMPRPNTHNKYPEILHRKRESKAISKPDQL